MQKQDVVETPPAVTKRLVFEGQPTEGNILQMPKHRDELNPDVQDEDMITHDDNGAHAAPELDDMSVEELQRRQEEIDRKIQEKKEAEKKAVIEQIVEVVHTYDIPIDELVEALGGLKIKRKGVKAVQKYQDPVSGATWSGRGKEPTWIRGKDRKKFLIPE